MNHASLSVPEIAVIGATRGMLGAGLALLLADRLSDEQRRAVGWTLFAIGAVSSVPIAFGIWKSTHHEHVSEIHPRFASSEYSR